ncbi:MAG: beta-ketoacyl-ACP synthase II [Chloroflexi bacterium]|nr:beta-ketoacyl-ACP synthase II [Chloroflexota bacterium]
MLRPFGSLRGERTLKTRVVITGIGTLSPLGLDVESTWQKIKSGTSGVAPITLFDASEHETKFAAEVKGFDPESILGRRDARRMDRFVQFAVVATQQALEDSKLKIDDSNRDRVGILVGTGIGGINVVLSEVETYRVKGPRRVSPFLIPMMLPDTASGQIAINFGARGPNLAVSTACATGTNAIGEACKMIQRGFAEAMITGGTESAVLPLMMAGFNAMGALSRRNDDPQRASRPFDKNRDGFVAGEGSAILILESESHAKARGAKIYGEVLGYGLTDDAFHISAPAENGAGAAICMKNALADAGLESNQIDYLNAHGTSTQLNDKSETAAVKTVFGEHAYEMVMSSTKSMHGHLLGAAGALEAIICLKAMQENLIPPTINYETRDPICDLDYVPNTARSKTLNRVMSNSFGFGGHNASIIFGKL